MKKVRLSYLRFALLGVLFTFVLFASVSSEIGEWYALFLYPAISGILSAVSSVLPFSMDEWVVVAFVFLLLGYPFYARGRKHKSWKQVLGGELEIALWIYVWFYWGWGMNYYRANFYQRAEVTPVVYDGEKFAEFLHEFTRELNQAYADCCKDGWMQSPFLFQPMGTTKVRKTDQKLRQVTLDSLLGIQEFSLTDVRPDMNPSRVHDEIKTIYSKIPSKYGLAKPQAYQHPKLSSFNSLYSNVAVLGFMGPFFAESHVNHELSLLEYPFTYAHELSHLLGVSSEAEANLWAYTVCINSTHSLIRFSGYFGLLSYVRSNAYNLLPSAEFEKWETSLSPDILAAFYRVHVYWAMRYNRVLGNMQGALLTFYLKRNKISSGQKNYAQVIGMLLALPDFKMQLD